MPKLFADGWQYDMEQWLRYQLNGRERLFLGDDGEIMRDGGVSAGIGKVERDGGRITGKYGTNGIVRWSLYPGVTMETLTHHHWKQTVITAMLLGAESAYGNPHNLRGDLILTCAPLHDLSETRRTDVNYHVKNKDPHTRVRNLEMDFAAHHEALADLRPEWRRYLPAPIDVNIAFTEFERLFWEAAEFIGYCLFMLEEVRIAVEDETSGKLTPRTVVSFYDDATRYLQRLEKLGVTFASVQQLMDIELRDKWDCLAPEVEELRNYLSANP